ncbi:transmembrane protein 45B-like protein [Tanacetum coccineum]|uniref:Transmembrane protein 45B-like protein n=1 Tax=Tanacetum coccineum TaxID=301880 RepID=A0ABQ5GE72_9ASTR
MTWHAIGKYTENGKMQHPVDGKAWKNFDTHQSYSMWPDILTTYNLPPWLCIKETSLMLMLLIPGPKSPRKDIDVYLRPLIDDLKDLWKLAGVKTIDATTRKTFNMRAMLLWTINDFPAGSSFSVWSGQGYKAYPTCNEDTPSEHIRQRYIDKDPSISNELFALACRPSSIPISVNSCVVNGVRFVVHRRDERRTTQNSSICTPGEKDKEIWSITDVEAPPDIIDVDEDDDFIDDEDGVPYDLADSDDEVLTNDDDNDDDMSAAVARGHGGDGGGDDPSRPSLRPIGNGCRGSIY